MNGAFFLTLPPCMGWYLYAVRVNRQRKLFVFVFALTSALTVTSVQNAFIADSPTRYMPYDSPTLLTLTVITGALLPVLTVLLQTCYVPLADGLSGREASGLNMMALALFVIMAAGLVPLDYRQLQNVTTRTLYAILLASILVIYAVVFRMLYHSHKRFDAQQTLERTEHLLEINREQYRRITENISYARRLRHDIPILSGWTIFPPHETKPICMRSWTTLCGWTRMMWRRRKTWKSFWRSKAPCQEIRTSST